MGSPRIRPDRLGEKLLAVRQKLEYSQTEMADALSDDTVSLIRQEINRYEKNERDPPLPVLLRYAQLANVKMEIFADDDKDLPW